MFYSISGELIHVEPSLAVIECGSIGYACKTTMSTLSQIGGVGRTVRLFTYLHVREDALEIFGFATQNELNSFKLLIGVSGVGPKVGLAILSTITPETLALCVATDDFKTLTQCPGVGNKLAQRLVLELKGKLSTDQITLGQGMQNVQAIDDNSSMGEAIAALITLGFARSEAAKVLSELSLDSSVEDMIKHGLKKLSGK